MRKLALNDKILLTVDKPARYIGGEFNSVEKFDKEVIRFVMCFPDVYEIGMSHLGIQILYDMFNSWDDVWCERVYSPWVDLDAIMRKEHIPLFSLESQRPVKDCDMLGITLQYEMCYTNILQILDLSGIPIFSKDRTKDDPFVIGGGPCTYNPEPIADFFDLFYLGEGETQYRRLCDLLWEYKKSDLTREEFLRKAAVIPGIYVPSLYHCEYNEYQTIKSFEPIYEELPKTIRKEIVKDLSDTYYPLKPIIPFTKITQERAVLEIQRGCIRGCRFCQAGQIYKPIRERDVEVLKDYALELLKNSGYEEISLSSLSSSDYSKLPELIDYLINECNKRKINISLPSLRIDSFSLDVMSKVQDVKKSSLTFAPEAGSQRMRNIINKGLTKEDILSGAREAFLGGWNRVKLYFMLGLPFETDEDITAIAELANDIAVLYYETVPKEERHGKIQIVASTSFFIPKPFTAFQWATMNHKEDFIEKAYKTRSAIMAQLNQKSIKYNWHEADVSIMEGIFARGDRRLSSIIYEAYKNGCMYDAWSEYYKHDVWMKAFDDLNLDPGFYIYRERTKEEIFPWDFIDIGVRKDYLYKEWQNAQNGIVTENCKNKCGACGSYVFECGICPSAQNAR